MRYIKKSTKFQPRENRALTTNNRPSVSAPVQVPAKATKISGTPVKPAFWRGGVMAFRRNPTAPCRLRLMRLCEDKLR